jgi:FMNH2-dependent dimethyl sulfone monooxygenase
MYGPNKFKLGLFGMNCSNGLTMTTAPERWDASWDNNVAAARLADQAGIDFLLLIWASGLLALTTGITVCGTLHVRFLNPIFAAKQIVTADHIGKGRFALNIVSGWNHDEFDMFGIELIPHDTRYTYTEEWVEIVKRVWTETDPFDHSGAWMKHKAVEAKPKPWQHGYPMLISAGASTEGRGFAARHVDCLFTAIREMDHLAENVAGVRNIAAEAQRSISVFASGHMVARPTRKEAEDFYHYIVHEHGDWEAADHVAKVRQKGREMRYSEVKQLKERLISGLGTYALIGSYDDVAEEIRRMSEAKLDGMALGLVNYVSEFPHLQDGILPRLERLGLRVPREQLRTG